MVANVALDSSAVSILSAFNKSQEQLNQVQAAVSSGHDVSKASDNPLFYLEAQSLRGKAGAYNAFIPKLTQDKSSLDKLESTIKTISETASKLRDALASMSAAPSYAEQSTAATQITTFIHTIQNLIKNADGGNGFNLTGGAVQIDVAPNLTVDLTKASSEGQTMSFTSDNLSVKDFLKPVASTGGASVVKITLSTATTLGADLSTATARATLLSSVSNWIETNLTQAAGNVGAFSSALDAELSSMRTNQSALSAEADALTKTDLTADSAKTAALQTQQQLLTNLVSMSNQRMITVLGLFR